MRRALFILLGSLVSVGALAQKVNCVVFTPETVAKMNAYNIPVVTGLDEYMTAIDLASAMNRALHCEVPRPQSLHDIDTAIAWRVTKFARSSQQLNRMFIEYVISYGQNTITSEVATKWLLHNKLMDRFNAWDAVDVRHSWQTLLHPVKIPEPPAPKVSIYLIPDEVNPINGSLQVDFGIISVAVQHSSVELIRVAGEKWGFSLPSTVNSSLITSISYQTASGESVTHPWPIKRLE
jgi:hypothetical protein